MLRYLSVCSGVEAATVAWHPLGWEAVGFSEIESFPAAVLAHHYPSVPNFGDLTKHETWNLAPGSVDLLVGGTPCQAFSVAGKRAGLDDPRGQLMLAYLDLAGRLRPRWIVWENVPGVLSSNGGRDFGALLGGLEHLGYGWAYRVLDAQWVRTQRHPRAVPQRRRRVFVVGCLGDATSAAAVLFERESVQRNPAKGGKARQGAAADAGGGAPSGSGREWPETVGTICADCHPGAYSGQDAYTGRLIPAVRVPAVSPPIAGCSNGGGANGPCRDVDSVLGLIVTSPSHWEGGPHPTLNRPNGAPGYSDQELFSQRGAMLVAQTPAFPIQDGRELDKRQNGIGDANDPAYTVDCTGAQAVAHAQAVAFQLAGDRSDPTVSTSEVAFCLPANPMSDRAQAVAHAQPVPYDLFQITAPLNRQNRSPGDPCHTLAVSNASHAAIAFVQNQREEVRILDGIAGALAAEHGTHQSTYVATYERHDQDGRVREVTVAPTLPSTADNGCELPLVAQSHPEPIAFHPTQDPISSVGVSHAIGTGKTTGCASAAVATSLAVRRLTPRECERLQGFPDDYTAIVYRGKPAADGPRYKAMGNSMAVNCMAWIGERIAAVDARLRGKT